MKHVVWTVSVLACSCFAFTVGQSTMNDKLHSLIYMHPTYRDDWKQHTYRDAYYHLLVKHEGWTRVKGLRTVDSTSAAACTAAKHTSKFSIRTMLK